MNNQPQQPTHTTEDGTAVYGPAVHEAAVSGFGVLTVEPGVNHDGQAVWVVADEDGAVLDENTQRHAGDGQAEWEGAVDSALGV